MEDERIINGELIPEDEKIEYSLRPKTLSEYIGQANNKESLKVFIEAAKMRNEPLDHVLLYGPPGLGKTTLANIIANEMGGNFHTITGPSLDKAGNLAGILLNLQENDVLFIDEIHRLSPTVEEILYPAMEDYCLDIIIGKGSQSKSIKMDLAKFTLIGATTRAGMLSAPLRDRFGVILQMEYYNDNELKNIVTRSADILETEIADDGALEIARRSRGTPRIANRLLKRVRDYSQVKQYDNITKEAASNALVMLHVDDKGLDRVDNKILEALIKNFNGGPVGIETLAFFIGEDLDTLVDVYEPYLLKEGFILRTPRGRMASPRAYEHLGIPNQSDK